MRPQSVEPPAAVCAEALAASLRKIVGKRHVLTSERATEPYRRGFREGEGDAAAVVLPGSLVELWRVAEEVVRAGAILIVQAANTGLTGGSTPASEGYDRSVVILSTRRLRRIHLIRGGEQAICLPGATLSDLEAALKPLGREPHSVIGSSCIGASVVGGICNNSGGALVRRGPAYTELALFGRVDTDGRLALVNHLGVRLPRAPEDALARLEHGPLSDADLLETTGRASDPEYDRHVRDLAAATPARFNADPRRLHEASGCAGRLLVFAVRVDTFPAASHTQVFHVSSDSLASLGALRRAILSSPAPLPITCEYMDRASFDMAERYGRDTIAAIRWLKPRRLPQLFGLKARIDAWARRWPGVPDTMADRLLQGLAVLLPRQTPRRVAAQARSRAHHLLIRVEAQDAPTMAALLDQRALVEHDDSWLWSLCTPDEGASAFRVRFAAAGAVIRKQALSGHQAGALVALDVAYPRNGALEEAVHRSPSSDRAVAEIHYGHFLCHVMHHDYLLFRDADAGAFKRSRLAAMTASGALYPAEHNVGHLYEAGEDQARFFRSLDPLNVLNPGIGRTSTTYAWT